MASSSPSIAQYVPLYCLKLMSGFAKLRMGCTLATKQPFSFAVLKTSEDNEPLQCTTILFFLSFALLDNSWQQHSIWSSGVVINVISAGNSSLIVFTSPCPIKLAASIPLFVYVLHISWMKPTSWLKINLPMVFPRFPAPIIFTVDFKIIPQFLYF